MRISNLLILLLPPTSAFLQPTPPFTTPHLYSTPPSQTIVPKTGPKGSRTAQEDAIAQKLSLGAPNVKIKGGHYVTKGNVQITLHVDKLRYSNDAGVRGSSEERMQELVRRLDGEKGVLLHSSYEFPGRYARWSVGFVNPPLEISGTRNKCRIEALNERGEVLLPAVLQSMKELKEEGVLTSVDEEENVVTVEVVEPSEVGTFSEEDRSRQPSLFSVVRSIVSLFSYDAPDGQLGLYGAFGYDLTFQFEPITLHQNRDPEQRDLVLYLPDEIMIIDHQKQSAFSLFYDFSYEGFTTAGMARTGSQDPFQPLEGELAEDRDTPKNEFANSVERAKREFAVGNLFEVVLSQNFKHKLDSATPPSTLFRRLTNRNPSPYGFFLNLGSQEYLVGASPEMFVRCEQTDDNQYRPGAFRIETCPISGTVARGADALEDAKRIQSILSNLKEESELTMCTDVDRNDKSRICEPGSVKVIGRRQIEMYSRLIHTVDHVEGYLREEFDALDAFLCHTWAVTVTGAPKTWAIQFVEENERSPRCWYGGAIGMVGFNGSLNTGLTLRTVRVKNGVAEVRAGATLLYDSNPVAEEQETELKASAMIDAIVRKGREDEVGQDVVSKENTEKEKKLVGYGKKVILIDHEDSFVHTLGNYLRQTGAEVTTLRSGPSALRSIEKMVEKGEKPDMVVLSPGPGNPSDFALSTSIDFLTRHKIPCFGVCLGLQGMVEHFGGTLGVLNYPMHGKPSSVTLLPAGRANGSIFTGLPDTFEVARYHSLYGLSDKLPSCLHATALSDDGIVMGIQHKTLPFAAVQFHPESILTSPAHGMTILSNALTNLQFEEEDEGETNLPSGAELVGRLEHLTLTDLRSKVGKTGLSTGGTKSELLLRYALWMHKRSSLESGKLVLEEMNVSELKDLKHSLGLKGGGNTKGELVEVLGSCLMADIEEN